MPKPNKGEQQKDFISRCVREVMGEGKDQQAALGQCYGTWRSERGGTGKLFCETLKQQPGSGDVHVGTAIGNSSRRRRRRMSVIDAAKKPGEGVDESSSSYDKAWSIPLEIKKAQPERQMIFGWASVVQKNGEYIVDKQGDIIPIAELENAVLDYMLHSRDHGVQHEAQGTGRLVMSFLTTPEYMDAFGLKQKDDQVGWIAGYKIEDPALWDAHKAGLLPDFSIGGSSMPFEPVDEVDDLPAYLRSIDKARGRRLARKPFR